MEVIIIIFIVGTKDLQLKSNFKKIGIVIKGLLF